MLAYTRRLSDGSKFAGRRSRVTCMQILTAIEMVVRARCCTGSVTLQHAWIEGEKGRMSRREEKRKEKKKRKRRGKGTKEKAVASRAVAFFSPSFFRDSSRPWFPGLVEIHQVFKRAYARWKRRDTAPVSSEQKGEKGIGEGRVEDEDRN